jgi:hypothetical protein
MAVKRQPVWPLEVLLGLRNLLRAWRSRKPVPRVKSATRRTKAGRRVYTELDPGVHSGESGRRRLGGWNAGRASRLVGGPENDLGLVALLEMCLGG